MPKCYKIVFLGSRKVGKTAIIEQLVHGHHSIGSVSRLTQRLKSCAIKEPFHSYEHFLRYVLPFVQADRRFFIIMYIDIVVC